MLGSVGYAEFIIGRAFARPVGQPTLRCIFNCQTALGPCVRIAAARCARALRRWPPPESRRGCREDRVRAAPAVSCAQMHKKTHTSIQVQRRQSGLPCAMVYSLLRALPGDRAFLPPSSPRSLLLKNLTPASGRQDHTASPSASRAFVCRALSVHRISSQRS